MNIDKYINSEWRDCHEKQRYLYAANEEEVEFKDDPILLIGIGGSGIAALSTFVEKAKALYRPDKMQQLEFLAIDTDEIGDKSNIKKEDRIIIQSADTAILLREKNENGGLLPKEISEWLDDKISPIKVMNGAAGIRQAGRLILFLNVQKVYDILRKKINKISKGYDLSQQRVQVFLFTGIGGGTGSGMFIDISYLIRYICPNAEINGIVIMPDVSCMKPGLRDVTKNNIRRNGFAALKELDYLMMLDRYKGEYFEQTYPGDVGHIKSSDPIFDYCILVGSMEHGRKAVESEEEIYRRIAEYMLTQLQKKTAGNFGIESFKSNIVYPANAKKPYYEKYIAIGADARYVAVDYYYSWWLQEVIGSLLADIADEGKVRENVSDILKESLEDRKEWFLEGRKILFTTRKISKMLFLVEYIKRKNRGECRRVLKQELEKEDSIINNWINSTEILEAVIIQENIIRILKNILKKENVFKRLLKYRRLFFVYTQLTEIYTEEIPVCLKKELEKIDSDAGEFKAILEKIHEKCTEYDGLNILRPFLQKKDVFNSYRENENYKESIKRAKFVILKDFIENRGRWLGNPQAGEEEIWLSDYIARLLKKTFEESKCATLHMLLESEQDGKQMKKEHLFDIFKEIAETQQLWPTSGVDTSNHSVYEILTIPDDAEIKKWASEWNQEYPREISLIISGIKERISKLIFVSGYALHDFDGAREFEIEYLHAQNKTGLHLYASGNKRWEKLPSPYYESVWRIGDAKEREEEKKSNDFYRRVFQEAKRKEIIGFDTRENMYCFVTKSGQLVNHYSGDRMDEEYVIIGIGDIKGKENDKEYEKLAEDMFIHMFYWREQIAQYLEMKK